MLINDKVKLPDQQKILDSYKEEINKKLIDLGIDITTMTDFLPLELPFNIPTPPPMEQIVSEPWIPDSIKESHDINSPLSVAS